MSRLDQHITAVRNKLALAIFLRTLASIAMIFAGVVWLLIIAERLLDRALPRQMLLFLIGCGIAIVLSLAYSIWRRPSVKSTAVAIDRELGLKEKFSTALYMRPSRDLFAMAAVKDAEREAQNVSLYNRFPITFPKHAMGVVALSLAALLTAWLMPNWTRAKEPQATAPVKTPEAVAPAQHFIAEQMPKIQASVNPMNDNSEAIKRALDQLNKAAKTTEGDKNTSHQSAQQALEGMKKALTEEMAKNEKFQTVKEDERRLANMDGAKDDTTPLGKAQNDLKAGKIDEAMENINQAVANFDKQKPEDQQKAVDQAAKLAADLAKAADDPKVEQKIKDQAQQMGATPQQAQQLANTLKQAAQGNQQAQKQLQQQAQQMVKNMNGGQGPTQQQQAQIQKMMSQMQGMANSQAQAQALSSGAQQLSQAMQQAQGQQNQPGQAQKPGGQKGQGQMAQAQANVQKQLQQMQAQAKDAKAMQAGANAAAQAAQAAAGNPGPGQSQQASNGGHGGPGKTQGRTSESQGSGRGSDPAANKGNGQGQGGNGAGGAQMPIAEAPFDTTAELDAGKENADGQILASSYVKAGIEAGKSKAGLHDVAASAQKDAPEDIDQDHISRDSQQAVKDYFTSMQNTNGN